MFGGLESARNEDVIPSSNPFQAFGANFVGGIPIPMES